MSRSATARIAAVAPQFVERAPAPRLDDWLDYFEPDIVLVTAGSPAPRATSILRRHTDGQTPCIHPAGNTPKRGPYTVGGVQFVVASTTEAVRAIADQEGDALDPDEQTIVISSLLELDVDTTALSTRLVGREAYVEALAPDHLDGEYVHVSTQLPADYRRDWNDLAVVGGGAEAGAGDTPLVALDCRADGRILTRTVGPTRLGLRALDGVGATRAKRLREAGLTSRADVASATPATIADLQGIGRTTADRIQTSARAIADGEIVRQSEAQLPSGDPVYVDIETDGLAPTITWLVGVLDGTAADGHFMPFLQRDPDEPGRAIDDFMAWYTANASHRPLVAYRGWGFDFTVLHDHIVEYCPHWADDWTSTYRFDPYQWAVEKGNAVLPGRTNTLEDVAGALGYERAATGLTGAAVARAYQQWMADRTPATELDWERFATYCEDDVRALATVYEALAESGRIASTDEPSRDVAETTTQGSLSDW